MVFDVSDVHKVPSGCDHIIHSSTSESLSDGEDDFAVLSSEECQLSSSESEVILISTMANIDLNSMVYVPCDSCVQSHWHL